MKISTVNYTIDGSLYSDTAAVINIDNQFSAFIGEPMKWGQDGTLKINLKDSALQDVQCIALCGVQMFGPFEKYVEFDWALRNGGASGTIVASGTFIFEENNNYFSDVFANGITFLNASVLADFLEITTSTSSSQNIHILRIWVGNCILLEKDLNLNFRVVNEAVVETSRVGEDFVLSRRYKREVNVGNIELLDNLKHDEPSENGDLESVFDSIASIGTVKEVVVDAYIDSFFGKLNADPSFSKLNGDFYQIQLNVKEF